jgi:ABC-type transport system involved in cytochrome c biogenesis permease subunit
MSRPPLVLLLCLALAPAALALDFKPLETMPVQEGGRKKPYLVFADESLLGLTGKTSLTLDGQRQSSQQIITGLWLTPGKWGAQPLILISNKPLKEASGLDPARKWFSRDELAGSAKFLALLQKMESARRMAKDGKLTGMDKAVGDVAQRVAEFEALRSGAPFRVAANPAGAGAQWFPLLDDDAALSALRSAYVANNDAAFAQAAAALRTNLATHAPQFQPPAWKLDLETTYQKVHPFRWAWILYLIAGITLAATSISGRRAGYTIAWVLAGIGLLLQIAGFVTRVVIAGRPPVSNMYESIIWVSFGAILIALIFEAIYRGRYFLLGASFAVVLPLVLADTQPLALNSSIEPLQPILQSNFWLSTHVLIITLSYAAFLLALGVGHLPLGMVLLGRKPPAALYNYIYRTLQVGVLLLATGTILGAIWANYSWGRFWDFDPKETWALTALLVYLFILHGRIAGAWGGFGLAVGAVLAFQTILMAWYGVNFVLGKGLHSYGFGTGGIGYAIAFITLEVLFTGAAIQRYRASQPRKSTAPDGVELRN